MRFRHALIVFVVLLVGTIVVAATGLDHFLTIHAVACARGTMVGTAAIWFHRLGPGTMLVFGGGLVILLAPMLRRPWWLAVALVSSAVVANRACLLIKVAVGRLRPWACDLPFLPGVVSESQRATSFPSSHATTIAALTLAIGLLAPGRWAVVVAAAAGLAIGALRVFAGAHYASDVLAGWLLGCSIMVATPALLDRLRGRLRGVATR